MSTPYMPMPTPGRRPSKGPGGLIALIALVLLCGAAGVVLAVMTMGKEAPEEATAEASAQPAKPKATPATGGATPKLVPVIEPLPDDGVQEVTLVLETTPPGAEVFTGGESIGTTPIRRRVTRSEDTQSWQIFLDGFEVEQLEVALDADFHSEVVLKAVAANVPPPTRPEAQAKADESEKPAAGDASKPAGGDGTKKADGKAAGGGGKKPPKPSEQRGEEEHKVITTTTGAAVPD